MNGKAYPYALLDAYTDFYSRNTHGTSFGDCIDLSPDWWDTHDTKFVNFRPATDLHTDPTAVRVYTSRKCDGGYDRCTSGVTTFNPAKKIKSYKVV